MTKNSNIPKKSIWRTLHQRMVGNTSVYATVIATTLVVGVLVLVAVLYLGFSDPDWFYLRWGR
jgi:hypothetical protein